MTLDADVLSAARRVAERFEAAKRAGHTDVALRMSEVIALLPVLDIMAARADGNRVERWARAICVVAGHADPDQPYAGGRLWQKWALAARSAIALAEADRARDRDAIARRLLSLHGTDLDNLAHARRHVDYLLDGKSGGADHVACG